MMRTLIHEPASERRDLDQAPSRTRSLEVDAAWYLKQGKTQSPQYTTAAERWAKLVSKMCESEGDLKTVGNWASFAGISRSSLAENCRILAIEPHDARDLGRVLRALIWATRHRCSIPAMLDVSDSRTLNYLFERAGLSHRLETERVSVNEFLERQHFIDPNHIALHLLRSQLERFA
jgi:hypothetical protein